MQAKQLQQIWGHTQCDARLTVAMRQTKWVSSNLMTCSQTLSHSATHLVFQSQVPTLARSINVAYFKSSRRGLCSPFHEIVPALVADAKGRLMEAHSLYGVAVAVITLHSGAMLHAVVAVPNILEEVHLRD